MADLAKAPSPTTKSIATADIRPQERSKKANEDLNASVLVTDEGTTIIHNDVVAKIAGMAVREVPGVQVVPLDWFDRGGAAEAERPHVIALGMALLGQGALTVDVDAGRADFR